MRRRVQRRPDRGDPAVHHVGRRDDICARTRVDARGVREDLERAVVIDRTVLPKNAAVPVRGVLAEAHVGDDRERVRCVADRADRRRHRTERIGGGGPALVLRLG